jgi:uncharacterized membrane-anchored protein
MCTPAAGAHATMQNKVPGITIWFWIVKILSTTVGETGADFLSVRAGLGRTITATIMICLLAAALRRQLLSDRYVPWAYWLVVVLLSIVGTQITDGLTDGLGVSLYASTAAFCSALAANFVAWYRRERTLSFLTINTRRRELFYWAAILCTFALGTAAGDLATEELGLGFERGVYVFGGLIALVAVAYRFGTDPIASFWAVYILTRPLGASIGDYLSQSREYGGAGLGTLATSAVFLLVIVGIVAYLTRVDRIGRDIGDSTQTLHPGPRSGAAVQTRSLR